MVIPAASTWQGIEAISGFGSTSAKVVTSNGCARSLSTLSNALLLQTFCCKTQTISTIIRTLHSIKVNMKFRIVTLLTFCSLGVIKSFSFRRNPFSKGDIDHSCSKEDASPVSISLAAFIQMGNLNFSAISYICVSAAGHSCPRAELDHLQGYYNQRQQLSVTPTVGNKTTSLLVIRYSELRTPLYPRICTLRA